MDDATSNKYFGHYVGVLVNLDLAKDLRDQIFVEKEVYKFFLDISYERLPLVYPS